MYPPSKVRPASLTVLAGTPKDNGNTSKTSRLRIALPLSVMPSESPVTASISTLVLITYLDVGEMVSPSSDGVARAVVRVRGIGDHERGLGVRRERRQEAKGEDRS